MVYVTNHSCHTRGLCQGYVSINFAAGEQKQVDEKALEMLKTNPMVREYFRQGMFSESESEAASKFSDSAAKKAKPLEQKTKAVSKSSKNKTKNESF